MSHDLINHQYVERYTVPNYTILPMLSVRCQSVLDQLLINLNDEDANNESTD